MSMLLSRSGYEIRLGRSFTGDKALQVDEFLKDASAIVRQVAEGALDDVEECPSAIVPVIFAMVNRGMHNPRGHSSEKIGDYSYSGGGSIYATDEEKDIIRDACGISRISAIQMTAPMPLHLMQDIWNNPTFP